MLSLIFLLPLASTVVAKPDFGALHIKESVKLGHSWVQSGVPSPDTPLTLRIGLKQGNIEGLLTKLHDISNPDSVNFRKWLTKEETYAYITPAAGTVSKVKQWLTSNGVAASAIKQNSPAWLTVDLPIAEVESLLATKYALFSSGDATPAAPRTLQYSLPLALHDLIDTIQPTTTMFSPVNATSETNNVHISSKVIKRATQCDTTNIFPNCVRAYYQYDYAPANRNGAQVGTLNLGNPASHSDAQLFFQYTTPKTVPGDNFVDVTLAGASAGNNGQPGGEGNTDTQWSGAMANGNGVYYITPATSSGDYFGSFADYVSAKGTTAPPSISISYSIGESDLSFNYANRICREFAIAGSQGISLFAVSGDGGAYQGPSGCNGPFGPVFPASCPYITAVGATAFAGNTQYFDVGSSDPGEKVANYGDTGGSGGGFSNYFVNGPWQQSDSQAYIKSLGNYLAGRYNSSGRGYPDVSALGLSIFYVFAGKASQTGGTSVAAPIWAGLVSVLNDYQISRGKPTLGFLNPSLYNSKSLRSGLKDITYGSGRQQGCSGQFGFPALKGWDAVTGLGTPSEITLRFLLG